MKEVRHKRNVTHIIPFTLNPRKCKQIYSDRKQIKEWFPGNRGTGLEREGFTKTLLGVMGMFIILLVDGFSVYIHPNQQINTL